MRPPMAYYGGKTTLAARISAMLPAHRHYVEPFAGSLAVLLAKPAARMETVNDLDGDLMTFWKVLREDPAGLARVCALTPHSRSEHDAAYTDLSGCDDVERARRVWVRITQGRTGTMRRTGWRHYVDPNGSNSSMPRYLAGYLDRMLPAAERLSRVSLEARPALEVIEAYGRHHDALLYLDPPYLGSTRDRNYRHEMTSETAHRELAAALHRCHATVVLSGYASDLYDRDLYPGWHRYTLDTGTSQGGHWSPRTEILWSNQELATDHLPLDRCNETPATDTPDPAACNETRCQAPDCGAAINQPSTGRRRRFCSTRCRVRAHRANAPSAQDLSLPGGPGHNERMGDGHA